MKINPVLFDTKQTLPPRSCKVKLKPMHGYFILLQCGCLLSNYLHLAEFRLHSKTVEADSRIPLALVCLRQKALQRKHKKLMS